MDKEKLYELCKILEFKMFIKKLNLEEKTQTSNFDHKPVLLSLFDKIEDVEKTEKVEKEIVYEKELNINFSNRELVIIDNETLLNEQKEYLNNYKKIASIY